jgi:folate-dependent phosphoribosylglycinamide formyltransferase PurN
MRTLIFTDVNSAVSSGLIRATLRLAQRRGDFEVSGFVTSRPARFRTDRARALKTFARRMLVAAANRGAPWPSLVAPTTDLARVAGTLGVPILVPPGGDPNDARFIEQLAREIKPEVALCYDGLSIFRLPLLRTFAQAVNYHAGLLPHYRGVMATSFSILAGESESGFTFHRMTERVDDGPILVQGAVPVDGASSDDVARRKLAAAIAALPEVLEKLARNEPGLPPGKGGPPFRARDWAALIRVTRPEYLTARELRQRILAFGNIEITIGGVPYPVTRLRDAKPEEPRAFRTVDGAVLAPDRFDGLPFSLYRIGKRS